MNIFKLARKSPKWLFSIWIIFFSTAMFCFWLVRRDYNQKQAANAQQERIEAEQDAKTVAPIEIKTSETEQISPREVTEINNRMFLAGNYVYQIVGDDIEQIEGIKFDFGGNLPNDSQIAYSNNRFALQSKFQYWVYAKNGRKIGQLTELKNGYITEDVSRAYYAQNGDLWTAQIDWKNIKLTSPKQLTNLGQFSDRHFTAGIQMASEKAMIYRFPRGLAHINLEDGAINSIQLPYKVSSAPGGKILIAEQGTRPNQITALDIETLEHKSYPINGSILKPGVVWVSKSRCLIATQLGVYDYNHLRQSFTQIYRNKNNGKGLKIGPSSFNHHYALIAENGQLPTAINIDTKATINLPNLPITRAEWIGPEMLLLSCDVLDSQYRGAWVFRLGSGEESMRVSVQPLSPQSFQVSHFTEQQKSLMLLSKQWFLIDTNTSEGKTVQLSSQNIFPIKTANFGGWGKG